MAVVEWFKVTLAIQLFYSLGAVSLVYALGLGAPGFSEADYGNFTAGGKDLNAEVISQKLGTNTQQQFDLSVRDLGSLAYFSGNILVDLIITAFTAIPRMFGILIDGIFLFVQIDVFLQQQIRQMVIVLIAALYLLALIQMLLGVRSGRLVV